MNNIKEQILEVYPSISFKNEFFLSDDNREKILSDFTLEDIAFRLSQLDKDSAWKLNMYLYYYGTPNSERNIIKFLVKNDISYFKDGDSNIYQYVNLIKQFEKIASDIDFSIDDLKRYISDNDQNNGDKEFYEFDISHFMVVVIIQKLYKEKKINVDDFKEFIDFVRERLKKKIISIYGNYDSKYDGYVSDFISYLISGKISLANYYDSNYSWNPLLYLMVKAKFGFVNGIDNLPIDVVMALNSKKINSMCEKIMSRNIKRFNRDRIMRIVINMCAMLGEHNVDNIINSLPNDEKKVYNLLAAFNNDVDISNILVVDRKIILNENFIKFFMGNKMNDPTSLLNLIYDDKTTLSAHLENLYYSFNELYDRYKNQTKLTKKAFFENFFSNSKVAFNPDEYMLEGPIINSYFDNRQHQSLKPIDFVKGVRDSYKVMKHNYQKTIPYVSGTCDGYSFETLKANDPTLYSLGASTDCCFKIGGQADSFVKYCAEDVNARVVVIKDNNNRIVAMIPMIRNGNLIVCNSIESIHVKNNTIMSKMFEILEIVGERIIDVSSKNEDNENRIQAILCGNYKNNIEQFNKYDGIKIYGMSDFNRLYPLKDGVSCNLGIDANGFYCIKKTVDFEFSSSKSFIPSTLYEDPRSKPYELEIDSLDDNMLFIIQQKIDAISFESGYGRVDLKKATMVIFNEDWYIVIDNKNNIYSSIVGNDQRALLEYNEFLDLERQYYSEYTDRKR